MCKSPGHVWVKRGPKIWRENGAFARPGAHETYWEKVPTPCKKCSDCKEMRVHDFAGRCMAEAAYSDLVATVTLTYAPRDDLAEIRVLPRHFQLFCKLLRRRGHNMRYFVAGEAGKLRGRVHFHAILFFKGQPVYDEEGKLTGVNGLPYLRDGEAVAAYGAPAPFSASIPSEQMVHINEWPHGHVVVDWQFSERSVRYCTKYLLKDYGCQWLSMSKKPALGAAFFAEKAAEVADRGMLPASFTYRPPGAVSKREYVMTGATRRDYLRACTRGASSNPPVGLFGLNAALKDSMGEWMIQALEKDERLRALQRGEAALDLVQQMEAMIDRYAARSASYAPAAARLVASLKFSGLDATMVDYSDGFARWLKQQDLSNDQIAQDFVDLCDKWEAFGGV